MHKSETTPGEEEVCGVQKREIHAANADEGCAISERIIRVMKVVSAGRAKTGSRGGGERDKHKSTNILPTSRKHTDANEV